MDDDLDLDAAAGLASSGKGKPRAPQKAAAPKPKKVLTPEQRTKESVKRKDRRHAVDARDEAIAAAVAQQQVTSACVAAATREALRMLGLNPSQHGLVNAAVAAALSTGSSAFPRTVLPDSPRASACNPVPDFVDCGHEMGRRIGHIVDQNLKQDGCRTDDRPKRTKSGQIRRPFGVGPLELLSSLDFLRASGRSPAASSSRRRIPSPPSAALRGCHPT
ncbi:hypothetical protein D1007_23587 [Hordeum vulgare]|nr:hypothetical protein D1007_23587 [Hordeum vulgare]